MVLIFVLPNGGFPLRDIAHMAPECDWVSESWDSLLPSHSEFVCDAGVERKPKYRSQTSESCVI